MTKSFLLCSSVNALAFCRICFVARKAYASRSVPTVSLVTGTLAVPRGCPRCLLSCSSFAASSRLNMPLGVKGHFQGQIVFQVVDHPSASVMR